MENTYIPLDMIYINENGDIVDLESADGVPMDISGILDLL